VPVGGTSRQRGWEGGVGMASWTCVPEQTAGRGEGRMGGVVSEQGDDVAQTERHGCDSLSGATSRGGLGAFVAGGRRQRRR
jgi:hypothetical protein